MTEEFEVNIVNKGYDGETKFVEVSDGKTTLSRFYLYNMPWTNFFIRRWVKSAKKTLKSIRENND